ncbi:site-specific integrase [Jongsikchunia kroppenstedtii]|uniref:site-specific integrase n=1 Tax=Jongsikchunia kroppenstedtii TaxID=1121721 RepID=UPI00036F3629|nr:site-specific integrase [Jongsikchunia kroppenstedtii]
MSSIHKVEHPDRPVRFQVRWRTPEGTQRKKSFETRREAKLYAATVETTIATGGYVDPRSGQVTVGVLYPQWMAGSARIKATTRATREVTWGKHVKPHWDKAEIGKIRPSSVRGWVGQMQAKGCKPATISDALAILRGVLTMAVQDRLIPSNPADGVKAPRREPKDKKYLTHRQVQRLADEVGDDSTVVLTLAYTGLRVGELAALRVCDIDFLRRRISVTRSVSYVTGKGMVFTTPKTHETRTVPFPKFLAEPLAQLATGKGRDDLLFGSGKDKPLRVGGWRKRVYRPAVERCQAKDEDFPKVTVHDLRATAVSLAISAGANVKAIQRMVGHASAAVTLDVYASLFSDDLEQVSDALDRARADACAPGAPSAASQ